MQELDLGELFPKRYQGFKVSGKRAWLQAENSGSMCGCEQCTENQAF